MPEMSKKYVPAHMHDKDPNPKLLKFVRRVTDRLPAKIKGVTAEDPEYWGFACIFEDELTPAERDRSLDLLLRSIDEKAHAKVATVSLIPEFVEGESAVLHKDGQ